MATAKETLLEMVKNLQRMSRKYETVIVQIGSQDKEVLEIWKRVTTTENLDVKNVRG